MPQPPTIGRVVIYRLSEEDARHIIQQRHHNGANGNYVRAGDRFPAMVVQTFPANPADVANLKVMLDGDDTYWATSRHMGDGPGTWSWPVIA
ncbi:hypothetical protein ACF1AX_31075 [Streptomyces sp. NPDC014802]|uniref:hypothetical protein n=1 Tax=Streptomyces sp. NPDC014802 TaxID=3364917 RepID=UPI0036F8B324